jgi:hypothetical protein
VVVGWAADEDGDRVAMISTDDDVEQLFNDLDVSEATDINGAGDIVGFTIGDDGKADAFLTTIDDRSKQSMPALAALEDVRPTAINDAGVIVGTYVHTSEFPPSVFGQGFRYDSVTDELEVLNYFGSPVTPHDINSAGDLVFSTLIASTQFVQYADGRTEIVASMVTNPAGWDAFQMTEINDAGQLAGSALRGGVWRAVRLDPTTDIPDRRLELIQSAATATAGQAFTLTARIANDGSATAQGNGIQGQFFLAESGALPTVTSMSPGCTSFVSPAWVTVTCAGLPDIDPGASTSVQWTVTYPSAGNYDMQADATFPGTDLDDDDHEVDRTITVQAPPPPTAPNVLTQIVLVTVRLVANTIAALARLWLPRPI